MLLHVSARWCSKIVPLTFTCSIILGICLKTVLWYKKVMLLGYLEVVRGLFTVTMELNEICFLVTGKHGSILDASRSRCRSQHGTWQDGEKSSAFVSYHVYWAWLTSTHEDCFEKGEKYELSLLKGGLFNLAKCITCSKNLPPVYQQLSRSRTSWTFAYRIIISAV